MGRCISLLAAIVAALTVRAAAPAQRGHDWPTFDHDALRSGASADPTGISAGNLGSLKRGQIHIDGTIDSSMVYLNNVPVHGVARDTFFGTTSYGKTLAIDADKGEVIWTYTPQGFGSWEGSSQITNATPVVDPDRQYIYAASPDGHIQKLAVADGHPAWTTAITTLPAREKIAGALNFANGHVIATTGGYIGDEPPYQGHVAILDAATGRLEHVWNTLCSDRTSLLDPKACPESDSAIWGRSGAVVDPAGDLWISTGNAKWDGHTYWGDSVLELDADATHLLANYTPSDTERLNERDLDLGSTSPVLLDADTVLQGGKDGVIRLLNVKQIAGTSPHRGGESQTGQTPGSIDLFTAPAVFRTGGVTYVFVVDNDGTAAWIFQNGRLQPKWKNATAGTSPIVAGGLLYVYDPHGGLHVYEPATGRHITTLDCGEGHWNSPIVVDGRIALPEGNANSRPEGGVLDIWRLP